MNASLTTARDTERACGLVVAALSAGRRQDARLVTGQQRAFGLNASLTVVHVPYRDPAPGWTLRTLVCGVALQCSPSKERIRGYDLASLSERERLALAIVEGRTALGWVAAQWPGLLVECERVLGNLELGDPDRDGLDLIEEARTLARRGTRLELDPLFGRLADHGSGHQGVAASLRRLYGRMPWSSKQVAPVRIYSVPVGGDGGVRNPNLPPPSRPEEDDIEVRADQRVRPPLPGMEHVDRTVPPGPRRRVGTVDQRTIVHARGDTSRTAPVVRATHPSGRPRRPAGWLGPGYRPLRRPRHRPVRGHRHRAASLPGPGSRAP